VILNCIASLGSIFSILYKCDKEILEYVFNELAEHLVRVGQIEIFDTQEKIGYAKNVLNTLLVFGAVICRSWYWKTVMVFF
jgi:hypothetical protein